MIEMIHPDGYPVQCPPHKVEKLQKRGFTLADGAPKDEPTPPQPEPEMAEEADVEDNDPETTEEDEE